MRRSLAAVIVLGAVVAACSSAATAPSTGQPQWSATQTPVSEPTGSPSRDRPAGPFTSIDSLTFNDDRRHVSLSFIGARDPADGLVCSAEYAAWTNVVGDVLEVGVFQVAYHTPAPPVECDLIGYGRSLEVELEEPFTGREWHDLAGYRHFLTAPEGLVEIDLPDGWQLVGERDVEESRTGRWERIYARSRNAPPEQSLVLYQAFDGPVNVTGGDDGQSVEVSGRPATLYTWQPTGELVLVWMLDGDGLALVAHEPTFSVDHLIELAESARFAGSTPPADGPPTPAATPGTSPATSPNGQIERATTLVANISGRAFGSPHSFTAPSRPSGSLIGSRYAVRGDASAPAAGCSLHSPVSAEIRHSRGGPVGPPSGTLRLPPR